MHKIQQVERSVTNIFKPEWSVCGREVVVIARGEQETWISKALIKWCAKLNPYLSDPHTYEVVVHSYQNFFIDLSNLIMSRLYAAKRA